MGIEITGDTLQLAQDMTQVERDALLIELYKDQTAQHAKVTFVHNVLEKLDALVGQLVNNPPTGIMGKMVSQFMPEMPAQSPGGLHLPPAPPVKRR